MVTSSLRVLDDEGIGLIDLAVHEPTLDDVFLSLTSTNADAASTTNRPRS